MQVDTMELVYYQKVARGRRLTTKVKVAAGRRLQETRDHSRQGATHHRASSRYVIYNDTRTWYIHIIYPVSPRLMEYGAHPVMATSEPRLYVHHLLLHLFTRHGYKNNNLF